MKKTRLCVRLGDLGRNRIFYYDGRRYRVRANLGAAGVSVQSLATRRVVIRGRSFQATNTREEVWAAASEVEIEVRLKKEAIA